ncbi:hypothetical protein C2S52_001783 [Perilla frutescens var. hirtella]|nr:hypothetical protein C2S52_001783 [Perilla frutescens var. hirtella]
MEGADGSNHSKRSFRRSSNSHISLSDTESMTSQVDSWHSPLRSESPLRSDDPSFRPENDDPGEKNDKAIVLVDKYYSPVPSPGKSSVPASSPAAGAKAWRRWPHSEKPASENLDIPVSTPPNGGEEREKEYVPAEKPQSENHEIPATAVLGLNKFVREEPAAAAVEGGGSVNLEEVGEECGVMAADKTEGWSGDSFDRYIEYRFCLAVNVIGFVYSGFQAFDLAYYLGKGKHIFVHPSSSPFRFCNGSGK